MHPREAHVLVPRPALADGTVMLRRIEVRTLRVVRLLLSKHIKRRAVQLT
jgi:hypothetical protein